MSIRQGNAVISGGISKNELRSKQDVLYQKSTGVSRGEIILGDSFNIYEVEILSATNFVFDTSKVDLSEIITFELRILLNAIVPLTFPSNVKWLDDQALEMTSLGIYYLVFRSDDGGETWLGNLQGRWSL